MATELGKAYIQIMPSAKGIKGNIEKEISGEAGNAGQSAGSSLVGKLKGVIATAAIGKAISATINQGAELQQSIGGIETLFKGSADTVKQYASQAFQSTGMSANEYMQNVTSFSASLISSLGGDTGKAAEVANMAMVDMSDNVNKMGSDMESVQNAYQGFAKQNYTMLDNLKLGYGGTKEEMQRLLKDATKLTGVKYDINNLSDVYSAIHAIQENLDITGTTAKEASSTLSGSFASMKAAALDFMGNLTLGMDITGPLQNLATTATTFLFGNLLPALGNILSALPQAIITAVQVAGPLLLTNLQTLITSITNYFMTNGPIFLQQGMDLITNIANGIITNLPLVINGLSEMLNQGISILLAYLPQWLDSGIQLVAQIAQGILNNLPQIVSSLVNLVVSAVATFASNLPQFLQQGIALVGQVAAGLISGLPQLLGAIPGMLADAANAFLSYDWLSIGADIISGIVNGIVGAAGQIGQALLDAAGDAFNSVLNFFGIGSPSRLMRDKIGKWLPAGIAVGVDANTEMLRQSMNKMSDEVLNTSLSTVSGLEDYQPTSMSYLDSGFSTNTLSDSTIVKLGNYIIQAILMQGRQIQEGISNIRMISNNREIARLIADLGFQKG